MSSRLSSLLVQDGVVSAAKMADALQRQVIQGGALDSNLLETKAIDEDALVAYLGKAASLPMQPTGIAGMGKPLPEVLEVFTQEVAQRFRAVPTNLRSGGVLQVLVTVDSVISDIDSLALVIRQRIEPWVVLEFRLHEAAEKVYGVGMPTRFARLLQRSQKAHEGRSYPSARLIDPIPRFGSLSEVRLSGPPMSEATAALLVSEAIAAGVPPVSPPAVPTSPAEKTEAIAIPAAATASPAEKTEALVVPAAAAVSPTEKTEAIPVPTVVVNPAAEKTEALVVPAAAAVSPTEKTEAIPVPAVVVNPAAEKTEAMTVPVPAEPPTVTPAVVPGQPEALPPTPAAAVADGGARSLVAEVQVAPVQAATSATLPAAAGDKPAAPATAPTRTAAPGTAASSDEVPRSSRSAPSYSGIDQLSMDEWESVSAADWLSVANKIEPTAATADAAPMPELPAVPAIAPVSAPVAQPVPAKAEAAVVAKPAIAASAQSPDAGRRGKKRNKGQPQPTAQAAQQKPAAAAPTAAPATAPAAPPVAKEAARPASPQTQKSIPTVASKPAAPATAAQAAASTKSVPPRPATATQSNPALKPASVSKPAIAPVSKAAAPSSMSGKLAAAPTADKPAATKPAAAVVKPAAQATTAPAEKPQPAAAAPAKAKPTVEVPIVSKPVTAELPAVTATAVTAPAATATVAQAATATPAAATAAPVIAAVPEPIPEPINSGRLGEPLASLRPDEASSEPPPSSASPEGEDTEEMPRPAPRIALALDESSGATLSLEAARELVAVAADRDAIFEALCRGARSRARFACVLTIHGEVAFGRVALEDTWLDRQQVGRVSVPLDRPSVFRQAAKSRQQHIGALGDPAVTNDPLRALGRRPPLPGAVLPILLRGRPVALLYLDDDGRELSESLASELQPLLSEVGQAFHRLVQQSKTGGLGGIAELEDAASPQEVTDTGTSAWRPRSQQSPTPAAVAAAPIPAPAAVEPAAQTTPPAAVVETPKAAPTVEPAAPVPVAASEQPTVPLRVDRNKQATQAKPAAAEKPAAAAKPATTAAAPAAQAAAASGKPEKSEKTDASPKQTGKHGKGSSKSPPSSTVSPTTGKDAGKDAGKEPVPAREDWAALIDRAGGGEEAAQQALLAGDEAAVQAVVAALPGPLRSQSRSAIGDQQAAEANLAHSPLLSLVLRMGGRAVAPLVSRLKQKDTPTRARFFIVQLLGEMPVPTALEPLFDSLYDADEEVRTAAAAALRNFPPSQAMSSLRARLRDALPSGDSDPKRLVATIDALGELRETLAVQPIIDLLDASDPMVADAAGRALQAITKQDFGRSRYRWSGWWRRHQAESRLQWLLSGLCHDSAMIRSAAQDELSEMSGDVVGYRFDQPSRERESAAKQWAKWWQRHGYEVA